MAYDFDRLGWLQFEQLCTALLELEGDIPPHAWAGGADRCRTVLSGTPLGPPLLSCELPAPVLVQCVWQRPVAGEHLALAIVRLAEQRADDLVVADSLLVLTNARLHPRDAAQLEQSFADAKLTIAALGPAELAKRLDTRAELRRAMPSVLGLRDLDGLVDPMVGNRSSLDRQAAETLARVFVPTRAYRRALWVLDQHHFAVLTGPPEMGKTAIARTVALAQLTAQWDAHECMEPDCVVRLFDPDRAQVFIADDAFGSTEYRADAADRWARDMDRILRLLDDRHWLIWTSRPAPLHAGLRRLHRERGAERFPAPAEVLVDASELDVVEKTLILFRHVKAADLPPDTVRVVRLRGREIVAHPHFTPERIRRFTARLASTPVAEIPVAVAIELAKPTEAMATSFSTLASEHRDLLIAMLDTPPGPVAERDLLASLRRHHDGSLPRPPAELVDRLADHFLRVIR